MTASGAAISTAIRSISDQGVRRVDNGVGGDIEKSKGALAEI
jgi:hypothetical protein